MRSKNTDAPPSLFPLYHAAPLPASLLPVSLVPRGRIKSKSCKRNASSEIRLITFRCDYMAEAPMKSAGRRKRACRVQRHAGAESPEGPALGPFGGGLGAAPPFSKNLYLSLPLKKSQNPPCTARGVSLMSSVRISCILRDPGIWTRRARWRYGRGGRVLRDPGRGRTFRLYVR